MRPDIAPPRAAKTHANNKASGRGLAPPTTTPTSARAARATLASVVIIPTIIFYSPFWGRLNAARMFIIMRASAFCSRLVLNKANASAIWPCVGFL